MEIQLQSFKIPLPQQIGWPYKKPKKHVLELYLHAVFLKYFDPSGFKNMIIIVECHRSDI